MSAGRSHPGPRTWSMYPDLHSSVQSLLESDHLNFTFKKKGDKRSAINSHDTNIMGIFVCGNKACKAASWSSKKIAVTIRLFPENQYTATVYHQRCLRCNWLSRPKLDASYAERIAYRLKKWSGLQVEPPIMNEKKTDPHRQDLCEGCKAGHCSWSRS